MSNLRVVGVKFTNGNAKAASYDKMYHYYTDDPTLDVDDYAVVLGGSGYPAIVRVYAVDVDTSLATKMLIGKVDMNMHRDKQMKLVTEHARRTRMRARLDQIKKEVIKQSEFMFTYTHSAEARAIMDELGIDPTNPNI